MLHVFSEEWGRFRRSLGQNYVTHMNRISRSLPPLAAREGGGVGVLPLRRKSSVSTQEALRRPKKNHYSDCSRCASYFERGPTIPFADSLRVQASAAWPAAVLSSHLDASLVSLPRIGEHLTFRAWFTATLSASACFLISSTNERLSRLTFSSSVLALFRPASRLFCNECFSG